MRLLPAIDLRHGRPVRLLRGERGTESVYGDSPVAMAERWADEGAEMLHVVDLDAAFGERAQTAIVSEIVRRVDIPVQVGGGIRTEAAFRAMLDTGAARVVFGTVAVKSPAIVEASLALAPEAVVIGVDVKDGRVAVQGWTEKAQEPPAAFGKRWAARGARRFVYTNVARDGAMEGLDVGSTEGFAAETGGEVVASGGIGTLDHLRELRGTKLAGVIVGKALYEGAFTFREARSVLEG